jgi:hypothetical protein
MEHNGLSDYFKKEKRKWKQKHNLLKK